MFIRIFVDTNCMYVNENQICKNPTNFGIFDKIRKYIISDQIKTMTRIYISETVRREFIYNSKELFKKQLDDLNKRNENFLKIFGSNLKTIAKIKWNDANEFENYLNEELDKFISDNDDIYESQIPQNLGNLFNRAFEKQPLFHETKAADKTYFDAGLKDNLLVEEVHKELDLNDVGIIISKDNDFSSVNDIYSNIFVTKIENLEDVLVKVYPKYYLYKILNELNKRDSILNIIDNYNELFNYVKDKELKFVSFDDDFCEMNEENDSFKVKVKTKSGGISKKYIIEYDLGANELLNIEEDE